MDRDPANPIPFRAPDSAVASLFHEVARLCVLAHVEPIDALNMLRTGLTQAKTAIGIDAKADVDAFVAGQVLGEWYQNSRFLDLKGNPAKLSISRGDFTALCRTASARTDEANILNLLLEANAVSVTGDYVAAHRRELILGFAHPVSVTRGVRLAAGFLASLNHNLAKGEREPSRFERSVVNVKLGRRHIPALLAYLSIHGQSFLEDLDAWMSTRENDDDGTTVGVGLFLFTDDNPN
jgi:hypothetical protein